MAGIPVKRALFLGLAGLVVGLVVLGVGGRLLMRLLAFVTPEPPRFTLHGTLQILGAGAVWGALTAPLLSAAERWRPRLGSAFGAFFGLAVMLLALPPFELLLGGGRIVAPPLFIVGTVVLFPLLFVAHGIALDTVIQRYQQER